MWESLLAQQTRREAERGARRNFSTAHAEALALRERVLPLREARLGPGHPETQATVNMLANSDLAVGRVQDTLALLTEDSAATPGVSSRALELAALQAWFGPDQERAATRRRIFATADPSEDPPPAAPVEPGFRLPSPFVGAI